MWAWRLTAPGGQLSFREVPVPAVTEGSVLVRLQAAPLLSYLRSYVDGELAGYRPPEGEFTPGTNGVGVIEATGAGVYGLAAGQRVFCSPYLVVGENVAEPAEALIALTALTADPASAGLVNRWRDGTLAELALVPASAITPVPATLGHIGSDRLAALSRCVVPYGGFLRGRLTAGEVVVVHGATGAFGSAATLVALAMGASQVIAAGRNADMLSRLGDLPRVATVRMTGDIDVDARALRAAAGPADCALDMIGRADSAAGTLAVLGSLRRGGRLVLMGSMTVTLPLDYTQLLRTGGEIIGNFMYPRWAPSRLLQLVAAGQLDLERIPIATQPLAELPTAMRQAEKPGAPLIVMV